MVSCLHPSESDEYLPTRSSLRGMVEHQASRLAQRFSSLKTAGSYILSSKPSTMTDFSSESTTEITEQPKSSKQKVNNVTQDAEKSNENQSKIKPTGSTPSPMSRNIQASSSCDSAFRRAHLVTADASSLIARPRAISITQSQINKINQINRPDISERIKLHPPVTSVPSLFANFTSTTEVSGNSSRVTTPALRSTDFPEELILELQAESQKRLAETLTSTLGFQFEERRSRDGRERSAKERVRNEDRKRRKRGSKVEVHEKPSAPQLTVLTSSHDVDKYFSKHPDVQLELRESQLFDIPRREVAELYVSGFSLPLLTSSDHSVFQMMQQTYLVDSRSQLPSTQNSDHQTPTAIQLDSSPFETDKNQVEEEKKSGQEEKEIGQEDLLDFQQASDSPSQVSHHSPCLDTHKEDADHRSDFSAQNDTLLDGNESEGSRENVFITESHFEQLFSRDQHSTQKEEPFEADKDPDFVCTCAALIICECDATDVIDGENRSEDAFASKLALLNTTISHCRGLADANTEPSTFSRSQTTLAEHRQLAQEPSTEQDVFVSPSSSTSSTGSWRKNSTRHLVEPSFSPPPIY